MQKDNNKQKELTGILNLSHFTVDFFGSFLIPLLPLIALKFNFSVLHMSIILSFSYFLSSILQPLYGYYADKQKKYYFTLCGLMFTSISIILLLLTNNCYATFIFILLANFGEGIYHPQATALITQIDSYTSNKNLGLFLAFGSLGFAIGPLFSGYILDTNSNILIGILALWTMFILTRTLISLYPQTNQKQNTLNLNFITEIKNLFQDKKLVNLINIGFIRPLVLVSLCIFLPFKWQIMGYSNLKTGILLSLFSLVGALGAYIGGILFTKHPNQRKLICNISLLFASLCGVIYFLTINYHFSVLFLLLTSFFVNQIGSINLSIAHEIIPKNKATISGIINGYNWGTVGIGLWITGFFITKFDYVFVLSCIMLFPLLFINKIKS